MENERHIKRKLNEYIKELITTNNLKVKNGSIVKNGNNIIINNGTIMPKILPENKLTFSTAEMFDIPDDDVEIWRYMDWEKFAYLISNKKLYMPSSIKFEDKEEGLPTRDIGDFLDNTLENIYDSFIIPNYKNIKIAGGLKITGKKYRDLPTIKQQWRKIYKFCKPRFYISCWTERNYESELMWKSYIPDSTKRETAVAIKTTINSLKKSIKTTGLFDISRVKYFNSNDIKTKSASDYMKVITGVQPLVRFMLFNKKDIYKDDMEVRLMTDNIIQNRTQWEISSVISLLGDVDFDYEQPLEFDHMSIPIDLTELIKEIKLSPSANLMNMSNKINELLINNNIDKIKITESLINNNDYYTSLNI